MNLKEDHEQGGVCWCGQEHQVVTGQENTITHQKELNKAMSQEAQDAGAIRPDPGDTVVNIPLEKLLDLQPDFTHADLKTAIIRRYTPTDASPEVLLMPAQSYSSINRAEAKITFVEVREGLMRQYGSYEEADRMIRELSREVRHYHSADDRETKARQ